MIEYISLLDPREKGRKRREMYAKACRKRHHFKISRKKITRLESVIIDLMS